MTAEEKETTLKQAGFVKLKFISKFIINNFFKLKEVKTLHFIKGVPTRLAKLEPTKQGFITKERRFLLEVNGDTWIKPLDNG